MKTLFGRHRVRATFYHVGAMVVLISTLASLMKLMSVDVCLLITTVVFFADYIAEMYDPHPDNPGTWFEKHFHRFLKDDGED